MVSEKVVIVLVIGVFATCQGGAVPVAAVPGFPAVAKLASFDPRLNYDPHPQYTYAYDVQDALTGDSKSQQESRNGDVVSGSYSFIEADGTRRIVEYTADSVNGFNAVVHREPVAVIKPAVKIAPVAFHFQLVVFLGLAVLSKGAVVPAVPVASAPVVAAVPTARLEELDAPAQYSFAYDVQDAVTGDSKAQYETRNGDVVQGSYSLIEADGTRRIVEYTADPINGFNAVVSREPATAVAAIAAPVLPYAPAIAPSAGVAPVLPAAAAPAPAVPASGPDSDVEVVEARSGPLVAAMPTSRDQQLRQQQEQQLQQLRELEKQQQEQLQQLQQRSRQQLQRQIQQRQQQQRIQQEQENKQEGQEEQQQQQQQQQGVPVRAFATPVQVAPKAQRLVGPSPVRAVASYTTYPNAYAYTAAYSSPLAYASPLGGLTYAPANALL
ncbi:mediator of RNA polymerase II transcription subunit 13-like [Osmia bicornis bicornis]|uniref:mediator of RNA polymerase II transcription subunit 13-like n=1 Tax=Osmia bicornis bicornis TaxID=1437191 RepID=UPI001EAF3758|nr:mediator of RNA polymerase II transcription subunit 13-like [Osmia bicornis bicornis]